MAKDVVMVGCRLPNGMILRDPTKKAAAAVRLTGRNVPPTSGGLYIPPRPYGVTPVDAEFWEEWKKSYSWLPALKNGVIFEAKSVGELESKHRDIEKEKTGLEGAPRVENLPSR